MLVVLMLFCFRLVNKVGVVIGPGLTKYPGLKVMLQGSPNVEASYNILKRICKAGTMSMLVPN